MNKTKSAEHRPNYKLRRAVTAGVLGAVGLFAAAKGFDALDNQAKGHYDNVEQTALKEAKTGRNAVVVLHEGVTYRSAPATANSGAGEGPDTVAGHVNSGEVLCIDRPITYVEQGADENHDTTWYGFTLYSEKGNQTDGSNPKNVYWVNATELAHESTPSKPLIDVYDYQFVDDSNMQTSTGPTEFTVTTDNQGNFMADLGRKGGPAATATALPEAAFQQEVQREHLHQTVGL